MAGAGSSEPNARLATLLDEAGWSPRSLAREINAEFGVGRVSETAPYHWRDAGTVPRRPLPAMTAAVLARKLGRSVPVTAIWPGGSDVESTRIELACAGMDGPWDRNNAVRAVTGWLNTSGTNRRTFLAVSGTALLRAVWAWLDQNPAASPRLQPPGARTGEPLFEHIETSIPLLQRLDDAHGGAAHLAYVEAQFRAVGMVLREGGHADRAVRRLLAACATLGQL